VSEPVGRSTAALRGTGLFERAVAPTLHPAERPTVPLAHGRTRPFRLGATFVPDPEPEAAPGTWLGAEERYEVVTLLGQGGMGRVYEARRERDGRAVAVKVLRTDRVGGNLEELVARFRQEAAAASRVGHPGIIETLAFERTPDGRVILVMALLRGQTFEDWMSSEGTLAEGLSWLAQFCDALHAAHEAGIVHRDIKPENLFLHREDDGSIRPTIVDFGLAKVEVPDHTQIETAAGTVLGTPYYLAPERALGKPLDRRADLYSVGVVLYELVTGGLPFDATAFMAILEGHVRRVPLDPRQAAPERPIPDAVCELVMALLSKDPAQRPSTAAEVALQLRQLVRTEAEALQRCPTGPRGTSTPEADTMSMLALASGHTAAPGASATADAATIAPIADGPARSVQAPREAPRKGRGLGLFLAGGAVLGVIAVVLVTSMRPTAEAPNPSETGSRDPAPSVAPNPAPTPSVEAATAAVPAEPASEPESVVAVPKPRPGSDPQPPDASAKRAGGGTNGSAKKRRRKPPAEDTKAADPPAPKSSLPAFKDDVYGD